MSAVTTIDAGTLQVGTGGMTGTLGTGAVVDNAALVVNRSDAVTVGNVISGTGTLTQAGTGTVTLTGPNTYSGATTISAGTLEYQLGPAMSSNSALTIGSGATLSLRADADTTFTPASTGCDRGPKINRTGTP